MSFGARNSKNWVALVKTESTGAFSSEISRSFEARKSGSETWSREKKTNNILQKYPESDNKKKLSNV